MKDYISTLYENFHEIKRGDLVTVDPSHPESKGMRSLYNRVGTVKKKWSNGVKKRVTVKYNRDSYGYFEGDYTIIPDCIIKLSLPTIEDDGEY